ncbi:ras-related protein Rab-44 [Tachyglossus aculeatus]|uniref:ras-related protein Rab-44 n=1 Tax=Tachyglossus aculeatus TaxID=9261 RepID=UPI0018F2C78B|nr:ras-related protein Rab-44 [Tachyglossus aculeatus]
MESQKVPRRAKKLGSSRRRQIRGTESSEDQPGERGEESPPSEVMEKLQSFFQACDADRKGFVTREDLEKAELNLPGNTKELALVFDGLDTEKKGYLTTEEFTSGLGNLFGSHARTHEHRRRKTGSKRASLPHRFLPLEEADSEERAWFLSFMEQMGANHVFPDQDEIWQLWGKLRQEEPQLAGNLEGFLAKMTSRIRTAREEKEALELTLKKRDADHHREVQQLYEEMEQQIQSEKERLQTVSDARSLVYDSEMQKALEAKEQEVEHLAEGHRALEAQLHRLSSTKHAATAENQQLREAHRDLEGKLELVRGQLQVTTGHLGAARAQASWQGPEETRRDQLPEEVMFQAEGEQKGGVMLTADHSGVSHDPAAVSERSPGSRSRVISIEEDPLPELLGEDWNQLLTQFSTSPQSKVLDLRVSWSPPPSPSRGDLPSSPLPRVIRQISISEQSLWQQCQETTSAQEGFSGNTSEQVERAGILEEPSPMGELSSESQPNLKPEPDLKWKSQPESEPNREPEANLELEPSSESEPNLQPDSKLQLESDPEPKLKPQSDMEPDPSSKSESNLQLEFNLELEPSFKSELNLELEPNLEMEPSSKSESNLELETTLELEPSSKSELNLELEPNLKMEPSSKSESNLELEPKLLLESNFQLEPSSRSEPNLELEFNLKMEPSSKSELNLKLEPNLRVDPNLGPEPSSESELNLQLEPNLELESSSKSEPNLQQKPTSQSGPDPEKKLQQDVQKDPTGENAQAAVDRLVRPVAAPNSGKELFPDMLTISQPALPPVLAPGQRQHSAGQQPEMPDPVMPGHPPGESGGPGARQPGEWETPLDSKIQAAQTWGAQQGEGVGSDGPLAGSLQAPEVWGQGASKEGAPGPESTPGSLKQEMWGGVLDPQGGDISCLDEQPVSSALVEPALMQEAGLVAPPPAPKQAAPAEGTLEEEAANLRTAEPGGPKPEFPREDSPRRGFPPQEVLPEDGPEQPGPGEAVGIIPEGLGPEPQAQISRADGERGNVTVDLPGAPTGPSQETDPGSTKAGQTLPGQDPQGPGLLSKGPGVDPDYVYHILFVGDSNVGKSSFLHLLHNHTFASGLMATVGLDYRIKNLQVDNKHFALQLWDTAGQERYHSMTKQLFRRADGIVLMYDVTSEESFIHVGYWLDCIREGSGDGTIVFLLGNKTDCTEERRVSMEAGQQLAMEHGLFFEECSAALGHNILEPVINLARALKAQEDQMKGELVKVASREPEKKRGCCP